MRTKIGMALVGILGLAVSAGLACPKNSPKEAIAPEGTALIPVGCFEMGDHFKEGGPDELPVHKVCLTKEFFMDTHEVTNGKYEACVKAGKCKAPDESKSLTRSSYYGNAEYKNFPVIYVDWTRANAYCAWAGGRLPSEAEWEYAARGGLAGKRYPWGDDIDESKANYRSEDTTDTTRVGQYPPNGYGLYDMAGNVWEWAADWYDEGYYASSPVNDPRGPSSGTLRVLRGGGWGYEPSYLRASDRIGDNPAYRLNNIGFRCSRD